MRIKYLAQGENILMLGFEPSTFCIQNRHSNHYTNCSQHRFKHSSRQNTENTAQSKQQRTQIQTQFNAWFTDHRQSAMQDSQNTVRYNSMQGSQNTDSSMQDSQNTDTNTVQYRTYRTKTQTQFNARFTKHSSTPDSQNTESNTVQCRIHRSQTKFNAGFTEHNQIQFNAGFTEHRPKHSSMQDSQNTGSNTVQCRIQGIKYRMTGVVWRNLRWVLSAHSPRRSTTRSLIADTPLLPGGQKSLQQYERIEGNQISLWFLALVPQRPYHKMMQKYVNFIFLWWENWFLTLTIGLQ